MRMEQGSKEGDFPELALPKPNSFIPTNLEILNKVEVTEVRLLFPLDRRTRS